MSIKCKQSFTSLRNIYLKSVESVSPHNLLSAAQNYNLCPQIAGRRTTIQIQGKTIDITRKRCHVVGFGKAVLGMAAELDRSLGNHLIDGLISIPVGTIQQFQHIPHMLLSEKTKIEVIEAANNNQPDEAAFEAAKRIKELASKMSETDILFVLISGGGSALLPLPRHPLTLKEKMELVRELANRGAAIDEMNLVRISLSDIKGGRLAAVARNAFAVISFVISDIVNDPVHLIASGPTCATVLKRQTAKDVLQKYEMWTGLPEHIRHLIETPSSETETKPGLNNSIYVVGDNRIATLTALQDALKCDFNPFIATNNLQGDIQLLTTMYINFLKNIFKFRNTEINEKQLEKHFPFDKRIFQHFLKTLELCSKNKNPMLLILSGEPTVKVTGSGQGGRNQELALRMALEFYEDAELRDIYFLSAGTDGIDGPTDAAGAIVSSTTITDFLDVSGKTVENVKEVLKNNDSYNFFKSLKNGEYHIITGHTGTNVMDLHLLLVPS